MAGWGGVMGWDEWSARHVENDLVMPRRVKVKTIPTSDDTPKATAEAQQEVKETSFVGSIWSWVSGRKRREEREEELKRAKKTLMERRKWRWDWNFHQESDPDATPVTRFAWSRHDDCWSPERMNYALVCTDQDAPAGLAGTVFAVGTPLVTKADIKPCIEVIRRIPGSSHWCKVHPDETLAGLSTSKEGRYKFSCCYYDGKIFMFGGEWGQQLFNDMDCFDIATGSWVVLETFVDGCSHPKACYGHASTSDDNVMYIHGGKMVSASAAAAAGLFGDDEVCTAELLSFDMATLTWKVVTPNYRQPPTGGYGGMSLPENYLHLLRSHHSLEHVDGRLIMFGGKGPEIAMGCCISGQPEYVEGFFEFNLSTRKWGRMLTTGYSPIAREMVTSALCGRSILYYGGYKKRYGTIQSCFSDLFMLDTDTHHVSLVEPFGSGPGARVTSMCAVGCSVMFIGGGSKRAGEEDATGFPFEGHSDMFLLSTIPSLQQICVASIAERGLDCSKLPPRLQDLVYSKTN